MEKKIRRDSRDPHRGMQPDEKLDAVLDLLELLLESHGLTIPDWVKRRDAPPMEEEEMFYLE